MPSESNPYQSPNARSVSDAGPRRSTRRWITRRWITRRWITRRRIALVLIATPFLLEYPIRYWVFNIAGGWLVSTELDPDQRQAFLGLMYIPLMFSITVLAMFPAFLLLWIDRWLTVLSAMLTILLGLLLIPALIFLAIGVESYLKFG